MFLSWLVKNILRLLRWQIVNITHPQALQKAVLILAPHTSNWDFVYAMLFKFIYSQVNIKFAIKKEVMIFPFGLIFKYLGAIPIDRTQKLHKNQISMVAVMVEMMNNASSLMLGITPEGTRKYVKKWKTGFYRIAIASNVPIVLGYIDYKKKIMGMGPIVYPTGDIDRDLEEMYKFYRSFTGRYSEQGIV